MRQPGQSRTIQPVREEIDVLESLGNIGDFVGGIDVVVTLVDDQALFFQSTFPLHESGQLDESTYRAYLDWFCSILATPGGGAWWETVGRPIYEQGMVSAVEERLARAGLHDIRQIEAFRLDEPDEI